MKPCAFICGILCAAIALAGEPTFDIPRLDAIRDDGMHLNALHTSDATDFDPRAQIAWNDKGLLLRIDVRRTGKDGDAVQILLRRIDTPDRFELGVSPQNVGHPSFNDMRQFLKLREHALAAPTTAEHRADGYMLNILLPWDNFDLQPTIGTELGMDLHILHGDASAGSKFHIRLAEKPSEPQDFAAAGRIEHFRRANVTVIAPKEFSGKIVSIGALANGAMQTDGERSIAHLTLPLPPPGESFKRLDVAIDGQTRTSVEIPDLRELRRDALDDASFKPCVFSGERFPRLDFAEPSLVEDLIGPYTLAATFYDKDFNRVDRPEKPGRYGAIVEIKPARGQSFKRFVTLFRSPQQVNWWKWDPAPQLEFPPALGINAEVAHRETDSVADLIRDAVYENFPRSSWAAAVLSALYETPANAPPLLHRNGPSQTDRLWWYRLKRKTGDYVPLKYLAYTPHDYAKEKDRRWPLVLFLHGAGERGDDLEKVKSWGIARMIRKGEKFPFIAISPQCPAHEWWLAPELADFLDEIAKKYRVDPDRVYVTGLSMGGMGAWDLATQFPDRIAAIIPIAGYGDPRDVLPMKNIPVWSFHGDTDGAVPISKDRETVEALKKIGGRVRFTVYPNMGHESWTQAYATPGVFDWLLAQRRGAPQEPPAPLSR